MKSKQKHPRWKEQPTTKKVLLKKWNQNGQTRPSAFDRIKTFDHHDLTAKHCLFGCSRSPDVDGIKILDTDDQAAKRCSFILMFCGLVIFIKNFDPINIRRPWAPKITMFCSEVIMIKTFNPIKSRRLGRPFQFHFFFNKVFLALSCSFLTPGVFLFRCNMGRRNLPDMYAQAWGRTAPKGECGHMLCNTSCTLKFA